MGATAFQKGLGAMHALSHPIGAELDAHHGLTNAVVMPYVLVFNREAIADRITVLARTLGLSPAFESFLDWILDLRQSLEIPPCLDALGFEERHAALLAPRAAVDPTAATNPRALSPEILETLYKKALSGDLDP
jgi:alcohol dehydrogenase